MTPIDAYEISGLRGYGLPVRILRIERLHSGDVLAHVERGGAPVPYGLALSAFTPQTPEALETIRAYEAAVREEQDAADAWDRASGASCVAAVEAYKAARDRAAKAYSAIPRIKAAEIAR